MKVMNPTIISEGDLWCSGSATRSCSTGATRRVTDLTIWWWVIFGDRAFSTSRFWLYWMYSFVYLLSKI